MTFWNRKPDEPDHWHKRPETDWRVDGEGGKKRWKDNEH
jgi:hypothetical protein